MNNRLVACTPAALMILAGSAQVVTAGPFPPAMIANGGFAIRGIDESDRSGRAVSSAGDVNGDGFDDIIIGAPYAAQGYNTYAGESYVVFGGAGINAAGSLRLSTLNGTNGFVIKGIDYFDFIGNSVSGAGDINGDGIDDIIIGAVFADPDGRNDAGVSYVIFGGAGVGAGGSIDLPSLNGTNGFVINGIDPNDESGRSVAAAGDVNGDGIDDIIIGALGSDPNGNLQAGESYVIFGAIGVGSSGVLELSSLNGTNGFVINGIDGNDFSGFSVSGAVDVNDDGIDDILIGAPFANELRGEVYVVFGAIGLGAGGALNLAALDGANGYVINGIELGDRSGYAVSGVGDLNGDAVDDLIIGASAANEFLGEMYVVFGGENAGAAGSLSLSSLNGTNGFVIGSVHDAPIGRWISGAGDINGDGLDDLVIGVPNADPSENDDAGQGWLIFGEPGIGAGGALNLTSLDGANGFVINGIDPSDNCGVSVSEAGDVNGDGNDDLLIGAWNADPLGISNAGESYLIFGTSGMAPSCPGDLNGTGSVDFLDLNIVLGNFGTNCN